jgi:hypothetical protein
MQESKRERGRGDPGIYTRDIDRRIREGIRERNAVAKRRAELDSKRDT